MGRIFKPRLEYEQKLMAIGPRIDAKREFLDACNQAIENARPVLECDLAWGSYLIFISKRLANACMIKMNGSRMFNLHKSTSILALDETQTHFDAVDLSGRG